MRRFDAIIVGAGQAGPSLAGRLADAGMQVAIVERKRIGGTCVNTGCMPTKTMVASARVAYLARRAGDFGVGVPGPIQVDMAQVRARAATVSRTARENNEAWLRAMAGCTLIMGHARFESADTLRVGQELLTAPRIFLNVGGRPHTPALPGLESVDYLTNAGMLRLDAVPRHLLVIGGSYIGLEFAQMFRRFGAEVTVIEMGPRLVKREDPEISDAIRDILEGEGIAVRTSAECVRLERGEDGIKAHVDCAEGAPHVTGSHVLLAVGRRPNTDDLGLEAAGIETDERGYIRVDDALATNVEGIWALGDCNGRGAFTHTAYNDFEIVAANLLDGATRRLSQRVPGYALYVDPPLGRAGMTEAEARATGRPLLVATRPMTKVGRAIEKSETRGLMKIVVDAETRLILGAAILGVGGDEAIHGVIDIMSAGADCAQLRWAVPIHPTVAELIPTLLTGLTPA